MPFRAYKVKIDPADEIFSQAIRIRDGRCMRCGKLGSMTKEGYPIKGLQNSHFFHRWREGTRFDPDNCDALCPFCHEFWEQRDPESYRDFKINQLGQKKFDLMKARAYGYCKKDRTMAKVIAKSYLREILLKKDLITPDEAKINKFGIF